MLRLTTIMLAVFLSNLSLAEETTVAVASNFTAAMHSIAAEYEKASNAKVILAFGSSGTLYAQIRNGAPFQAFFSADQAKPIALEKDGMVVPGSRFTYAVGALALWSKHKRFDSIDATTLQQGQFNKLALANPRLAPYGAAAVEVLQSLQLEPSTKSKWVQGENIAQTYQFVDTGNADLGFVALAQIMCQGRVTSGSAWIVPQSLYRPIRQDAVLLRKGETSRATREFLQFVRSIEARKIIESYGYKTAVTR